MTLREKLVKASLIGILALVSVGCEPETKKWDEPLKMKPFPEWKEKESKKIIYSDSKIMAERKIYEEYPCSYS